jgi:hypothetical protein
MGTRRDDSGDPLRLSEAKIITAEASPTRFAVGSHDTPVQPSDLSRIELPPDLLAGRRA